jgi:hypothetical protein
MSCNSFCQDQLPEQLLNDCGATVTGGGDQAIIFACDATTTDFSDEVTIAADIASGKATLFQAIKVGVPAQSAVAAGASYIAGAEPNTTTYTIAGTWMDQNVNDTNDLAYAAINASSGTVVGAILIKPVDEATVGILVRGVKGLQFVGSLVFPDDNTDNAHYEFTFNGKFATGIKSQVLPVGIFS